MLLDWYSAAGALFNQPDILSDQRTVWTGGYDICPRIGANYTELWRRIESAGDEWWVDLKPLPWFRYLFHTVAFEHDTYLVSSPCEFVCAASGKMAWARSTEGVDPKRLVLTSQKHLLAAPGTVLIDDHEDNVEGFIKNGGIGILFPAHWNRLAWVRRDNEVMRQFVRTLVEHLRDPSIHLTQS